MESDSHGKDESDGKDESNGKDKNLIDSMSQDSYEESLSVDNFFGSSVVNDTLKNNSVIKSHPYSKKESLQKSPLAKEVISDLLKSELKDIEEESKHEQKNNARGLRES